jgi:hypothetical protein
VGALHPLAGAPEAVRVTASMLLLAAPFVAVTVALVLLDRLERWVTQDRPPC